LVRWITSIRVGSWALTEPTVLRHTTRPHSRSPDIDVKHPFAGGDRCDAADGVQANHANHAVR
jgi:hypothetical protein